MIMESVICFNGFRQDSEEFFKRFNRLAVLKKLSQEEKMAVISTYLQGPALSFYRTIESQAKTYEELEKLFKEEFPPQENYEELFYHAKQENKEDVLSYFYRLQELATKAKIVGDEKFINQFLKTTEGFYKHKLVASIYSTKKELRKMIDQLMMIYGPKEAISPTHLPLGLEGFSRPMGVLHDPHLAQPSGSVGERQLYTPPRWAYGTPSARGEVGVLPAGIPQVRNLDAANVERPRYAPASSAPGTPVRREYNLRPRVRFDQSQDFRRQNSGNSRRLP